MNDSVKNTNLAGLMGLDDSDEDSILGLDMEFEIKKDVLLPSNPTT